MKPANTARLEFRHWSLSDVELASRLWCDSDVMRFLGGPYSQEEVRERLAREVLHQTQHHLQYWPVFVDGEFAGCCGLKPVPDDPSRFEIGFHFLPAYWGRGYASEAARAAMTYAHDELGLRELFAGHHPQNDSSHALLLRLGFVQIGAHLFPRTGLQHPWLRWSATSVRTASPASPSRDPV